LAPEIVVFYNRNWVEIGTKALMSDIVSLITNIDQDFLMGMIEVKTACVAQKMSWASKRETTRLEDRAYCLMGLFEVNMPLLYGEGMKAFYRLQLEIIRNCSDESIFAWGCKSINVIPETSTSWFYGLLAEDPRAFQGSGDIVEEFSFRPPYTMTNKGLQIMVNLVSPSNYMATEYEQKDDEKYPKWVLTLHCRRLEENSKSLAIYLIEGGEGCGWARISDLVLFSPYSENRDTIESYGFERRQIIIQAEPAMHEAIPSIPYREIPLSFSLDVRSVTKFGYSICVRMNNFTPLELNKTGRSIARFVSVNPKFHMSLECTSPEDNFRLVLMRQILVRRHTVYKSRKLTICVGLASDKDNYRYNDRVCLPSGKVVKVVVKRKVESGKPNYVLEVLMQRV
jgi:hypothetical protein